MILECSSCGRQYPPDFKKLWGKTVETNGYGGQMQCINLVPSGLTTPSGESALEVCGGVIGASPDAAAEPLRMPALTLNDGTKVIHPLGANQTDRELAAGAAATPATLGKRHK